MNGKLAVFLLVLGIGYATANNSNNCNRPAWWYGKDSWYGPSEFWCPGQKTPVWDPFVLEVRLEDLLTSVPARDYTGPIKAGDPAVIKTKIRCPANAGNEKGPAPVVGTCSLTGLYLYDVPAYCPENNARAAAVGGNDESASTNNNCSNKKDGGLVDYTVVCVITTPCGDYGVGTKTSVIQAEGPTGRLVGEGTITGGTGAYAAKAARGGTFTLAVGKDKIGGKLTVTNYFIRKHK